MGKSAKSSNTSKRDAKKDSKYEKVDTENQRGGKKGKERIKSRKGKFNRSYDTREEIELANILAQKGMNIIHMSGDGNCMFRSISDQITGDCENYEIFREKIMDYISEHKDHFALFMEDDENMGDYIKRMRDDGEWGGHQELYAASQRFQANITIFQLDGPTYAISADTMGKSTKPCKELRLSYHGECHYNSVRLKENFVAPEPSNDRPKVKNYVFDADVDAVKAAVPWIEQDKIKDALQRLKGNAEAAIDFLCAGVDGLDIAEENCGGIDENPDSNTTEVQSVLHKSNAECIPSNAVSVVTVGGGDGDSNNEQGGKEHRAGEGSVSPTVSSQNTATVSTTVVSAATPGALTVPGKNEAASSTDSNTIRGGDSDNQQHLKAASSENHNDCQDKLSQYRKSGQKSGKPLSKKEQRLLKKEKVNKRGAPPTELQPGQNILSSSPNDNDEDGNDRKDRRNSDSPHTWRIEL